MTVVVLVFECTQNCKSSNGHLVKAAKQDRNVLNMSQCFCPNAVYLTLQ